jgi:hypothetical protein
MMQTMSLSPLCFAVLVLCALPGSLVAEWELQSALDSRPNIAAVPEVDAGVSAACGRALRREPGEN